MSPFDFHLPVNSSKMMKALHRSEEKYFYGQHADSLQ